jgi:hypothetical protein
VNKALLVHVALLAVMPHAHAQSSAQTQTGNSIRYNYGDNSQWADPNFDDRTWTIAKVAQWPPPPVASDGFVWVRIRVSLPAEQQIDPSGPVSIRESKFQSAPPVAEIYLDGKLVGGNGKLPPHPEIWTAPAQLVFSVPPAQWQALRQTRQNSAVIAVRAWIPPGSRGIGTFAAQLTIDRTPIQIALARDSRDVLLLAQVPELCIGILLALVGFGLIPLGIRTQRRELLLFAVVLITGPLQSDFYLVTDAGLVALPAWIYALAMATFLIAVPVAYSQFLWEAFNLKGRLWKYLIWGASTVSALILVISEVSTQPNWLVRSFGPNYAVSGLVRDVVESGGAVWALFTRRSGRFLAFAILLTPLTSMCGYLGDIPGLHLFHWIGNLFDPANLLGGVAVAIILLWRAWTAWRGSERMQAELDAAREIQQRLVPAALPAVPGFTIEAAYIPAQEVGGDFYQILPRPDGSTVIAVGDVSGKGLKAAMTGTLTIGALRTLAFDGLGPAAILHRLNNELVRAHHEGFVTCLCAVLEPDSTLLLANAGHLPPILNAAEIEIPGTLPLGLAPGVAYEEQHLLLRPGQKLTLLSDGVLEATNATGELFGFDRTVAISTQSADQIAAAAQAHGQEDDITVLSITFVGVCAAHALDACQTQRRLHDELPSRIENENSANGM